MAVCAIPHIVTTIKTSPIPVDSVTAVDVRTRIAVASVTEIGAR